MAMALWQWANDVDMNGLISLVRDRKVSNASLQVAKQSRTVDPTVLDCLATWQGWQVRTNPLTLALSLGQ